MRRREFITLIGAAAAAAPSILSPLPARAQQRAGRLPTIGFLGTTAPLAQSQWTAAFVRRLRELDWIDGRTVAIEYRWAESRNERFNDIAAEFIRLKVDVIVTTGVAAHVAKQATSVIPIVFALGTDPLGTGLVASLARPGGNVTGLSTQTIDLAGKRIELMCEVVPDLRRFAIMANVSYPAIALEVRELEVAGRPLGLDFVTMGIQRAEDIVPAFEAFKGRADALYVASDALVGGNRIRINTLATAARLPTMFSARELVDAGGLMSYGPNYPDLFRRAAEFVDKILRGTKPADIPVEQPTKFELVINLTTAKVLRLQMPDVVRLRADEVIE
jgi:putative ABC transport system substrate-binding protein